MSESLISPPLHLSVDPLHDQIVASVYGIAQRRLQCVPTTVDELELLITTDGMHAGFRLFEAEHFSTVGDDPVLWETPRHLVPVLDPRPQCIGDLVLRARVCFATEGTPDVTLALEAESREADGDPEAALACWYDSLAAGNLQAHQDIGRVLLELGNGRR